MKDYYHSDKGIHIELPQNYRLFLDIPPWYKDPQTIMGAALIILGITIIILAISL